MNRLPHELLLLVAQHTSLDAELAALAAVSRALHAAAVRVLYRHLVPCHPNALVALAKNPALAMHVRSLAVVDSAPLSSSTSTPTSSSSEAEAMENTLARALSAMPALAHLSLALDAHKSTLLDLLPPTTRFPALLSFSASSFALDGSVARFLGRTPALASLSLAPSLPSSSPSSPSPPPSLPSLTHFSGSLTAALALTTPTSLASLLALDGDLSPAQLALFPPLHVLSASTSADVVPFLRALARCHPTLAYLRLAAPLAFVRDATFPDITFYEHVAAALDALPALVDFELAGMHWPSHVEPASAAHDNTSLNVKVNAKRVWHSAPSSPRPASPSLTSLSPSSPLLSSSELDGTPSFDDGEGEHGMPSELSQSQPSIDGAGDGDLYEELDVLF